MIIRSILCFLMQPKGTLRANWERNICIVYIKHGTHHPASSYRTEQALSPSISHCPKILFCFPVSCTKRTNLHLNFPQKPPFSLFFEIVSPPKLYLISVRKRERGEEMEVGMMWWVGGVLVGLSVLVKVVLERANSWLHESKLGEEKKRNLPPGDLGLPFIGNMWSFLKAFKSSNPDSFLSSFISRSLSLSLSQKCM